MTIDKIGKFKDDFSSIATPIVDHALMVEEGDAAVCLHSSHLSPRSNPACETALDSRASSVFSMIRFCLVWTMFLAIIALFALQMVLQYQ